VAHRKINAYGVWWGDIMERDYLKDLGIDGDIILKCTLNMMRWRGVD
jgi:hypothetical protein